MTDQVFEAQTEVTPLQPNLSPALDMSMTIYTSDGQALAMPAEYTVMDFVGTSTGFERLGQLKIGQPADPQFGGVPGGRNEPAFFIKKKVRVENSRDYVDEVVGPIPAPLTAVVIGITPAPQRSYFASKYTEGQQRENSGPDCHSENFMQRDARYQGKPIPLSDGNTLAPQHLCAVMKPNKNGQGFHVESVCPLSIGSTDSTGKYTPSACTEQWLIAIAVYHDGEWHLIESYYKTTARTQGKNVSLELRNLQKQGVALYRKQIILKAFKAGAGNTFMPSLSPELHEYDPEVEDKLIELTAQWDQALVQRAKNAAYIPEDKNAQNGNTTSAAEAGISITDPNTIEGEVVGETAAVPATVSAQVFGGAVEVEAPKKGKKAPVF